MGEIRNLLSLELRSFYGINKFLHTKDQKLKNRYRVLTVSWIIIICMIFTYVGALVKGLCILGLSEIAPAYLAVLSSMFIIFFGMFSSGNRIFTQKGYDILVSMPVSPYSIVISRFLGLYIADLVVTLVITIPGMAVYASCVKPDILFYLLSFVSVLFVPAIPLVISTLIATLIMAVSSRMKNKSMMQSLLSVAIVIGIMAISFSMESVTQNMTEEQFFNLAKTIAAVFSKVYPPSIWFNSAIIYFDILKLILFIAVSVASVFLTVLIVSKSFNFIVRNLFNFTAKHNYKVEKTERKDLLKSLYLREVKRYFSSSIYVTNTIIGPVLALALSIFLCVTGYEKISNSIPIDILAFLPFVFSAVIGMCCTTSVSLSMEGKQFWIVKSLPIPIKALLDSKILLNLSLVFPFYLISEILFAITFKPDLNEFMWLLIIPAVILLFTSVFGITVNLKFNSFDWENETSIVKQSFSSMIGTFAGFILSAVLGVAVFLIPQDYTEMFKIIICLLILRITLMLYKSNNKKNLMDL